jgi:hypothetical protein
MIPMSKHHASQNPRGQRSENSQTMFERSKNYLIAACYANNREKNRQWKFVSIAVHSSIRPA